MQRAYCYVHDISGQEGEKDFSRRVRTILKQNKVPSFGGDTEDSHHLTKYTLVILKTENSQILSVWQWGRVVFVDFVALK